MIWLIGLGGAAGTLLRYYGGRWVQARGAAGFPWGTWAINLSGSLLLGLLTALYHQSVIQEWAWLMIGTGFCGGYTTFSTFGFETIQMVQRGERARAAIYALSSLLLGGLCAFAGLML